MNNIGLPNKEQWKKVLTAAIFSFVSTLLGTFTAAGGIQDSTEATLTLVLSCIVSALNATLYMIWITFFKESKSE